MLFNRFNSGLSAALGLSLVLFAVTAQAGRINSNLQIEPAQTFELGGGQKGGFVVTGRNTGPVAVVMLGQVHGAKPVGRGTVAPVGNVHATIGPGETALLRNTSAKETARLKLKVSGATAPLGMIHSANP